MSENSENTNGNSESKPKIEPAFIPEEKQSTLPKVTGSEAGRFFKFDGETKNIADALMIIVGGAEKDTYSMLERTAFPDKYTADLFADAIQLAEHGAGGDNLDFPIPQLGEWVVHKMRGYVSINSASRDAYERAASAWVVKLYQKEAERAQKGNPLLVGG